MHFTAEKLQVRIPQIIAASVREETQIDPVQVAVAPGTLKESAMAAAPAPDDSVWQPLRLHEKWGHAEDAHPNAPRAKVGWWDIPADGGRNLWIRFRLRVPEAWRGTQVLLALDRIGEIESIVYVDGQALAGVDWGRRTVLLPEAMHNGEHDVLVRCFVAFTTQFEGVFLQRRDMHVFRLGHSMRAMLEAITHYPASDPALPPLMHVLNDVYNSLDLREGWGSDLFARSAHEALDRMEGSLRELHPDRKRPHILASGHAHLDIGWLWPVWRSRQKFAHTVATALHLMDRYPDYHFSASQPQLFAYLKENDPDLYARVKERAAEGRFEPVGAMWVESDCNVPSGESLVRQLVYGMRFWLEEFGKASRVVWLPDVFGYSAALPQLMRKAGIQCFVTTKISWNQFNRMPMDTFRWRGIDGSDVLAHFITATSDTPGHPADPQGYTYVGDMSGTQVFEIWNHYRQKAVNDELLYLFGWGDGGGGPTEEMLEAMHTLRDVPGLPQVQGGRVEAFVENLVERVWNNPNLPVWSGELYLEYHRGTYTSQAHTKQGNRMCEEILREAEWLNSWATLLGAPSQQSTLDEAWKLVLLNQFHDILPGSSIPVVYEDSSLDHDKAISTAQSVREWAARFIASKLLLDGASYVVFNSLPWPQRDVIAYSANEGVIPVFTLADGSPAPSQVNEVMKGDNQLLIEVEVPAYGFTVLRRTSGKVQSPIENTLTCSERHLENHNLRLELDDNGEIASLFDKQHQRECIAPGTTGNQLVAYEDRPLNWDAWDIDIFYEEKPYPVRDILSWRVIEHGPLRADVEIKRRCGSSTITQRITMWHDRRRVDFVTLVDWQERQVLLRALFPVNINANRATCEIQFGAVERPTHRNTSWDVARFEVCAHKWVDMSEGGYGVALLNNGKYGHSLHHNVIGLSLLKGAVHPDPLADKGWHNFTYSLLPHQGDWRQGEVVRHAYDLNTALYALSLNGTQPQSHLPAIQTFVTPSASNVVVETIKTADDGDGFIVRLYEAHNERGRASLTFGQPVQSALEVNLLEEVIGAVDVSNDCISFDLKPFEVKTLRVRL